MTDELASRLHCVQPQISHWEAGQRTLNVNWLMQLAEELGVDPGWLLTGIGLGATAAHARRIASAASALRTVANRLTSLIEAQP